MIFPLIAHAETITYNICKSGCEYDDLNNVLDEIITAPQDSNVIINFDDSETYQLDKEYRSANTINSFTINGNNNELIIPYWSIKAQSVEINNISTKNYWEASETNTIDIDAEKVKVDYLKANNISVMYYSEGKNVEVTNSEIFNFVDYGIGPINISDSKFNKVYSLSGLSIYDVNNVSAYSWIISGKGTIKNSTITLTEVMNGDFSVYNTDSPIINVSFPGIRQEDLVFAANLRLLQAA